MEESEKLKRELIDLGVEPAFIEAKDVKNISIAKQIVKKYDFGRKLRPEEKRALLMSILNDSHFNVNRHAYLTKLIEQLEQIGFNTQEIYGMIINLGVNRSILVGNQVYHYYDFIQTTKATCNKIKKYKKNEIQTSVSEVTIMAAIANNLSSEDKKVIKEELVDLGIERAFIDAKDIKNLYVAKQIVENYDFERELKPEEKRALLMSILRSSNFNINMHTCLTKLIKNFKEIGLTTQEIYGIIINLGVNGSILIGENRYSYGEFIGSTRVMCYRIKPHRDEIQTSVSENTIMAAIANNLSSEDKKSIKEELVDLGIEQAFIDAKDIRNVYIAKRIVENYDFGRKLKSEEKRALLMSILNNNYLNVIRHCYLTSLIKNMEEIGLTTQEIYGMIINLGVNKRIVKVTGFDYGRLLLNVNGACQALALFKDEIATKVSEETIQKAVEKANKPRMISGKNVLEACSAILVPGNGGSEKCDLMEQEVTTLMPQENLRGEEQSE